MCVTLDNRSGLCEQVEAAKGFLAVLRSYLDSLCSNLRSHTITNVQSNDDKVCSSRIQYITIISMFICFHVSSLLSKFHVHYMHAYLFSFF